MTKIYTYEKCSTCKKALAFLDQKKVAYRNIPIRETPPSVTELKKMLKAYEGEIRKLFNTSGMDYKQLNMKEKLPKMSESQALELLAKTGNLVKRPFLIGEGKCLVGFKEEEWKKTL